VSQLGLMFQAMGVGAFGAGIIHLYTHAFFKALLFLGSGAVIHALHGEQDIRNMGGLKQHLPITYWTFVIGSLALAGFPGLAGFFSKDELLFETFTTGHTLLFGMGVLTSLLTTTYMGRLVFLTFWGERRHDAPAAAAHGHGAHGGAPHEAPAAMAFTLIVLAIGSVLAGYVGVPHALGGHNHLATWLAPSFSAPGAVGLGEGAGEAAAGAEGAGAAAEEALELTLMALSGGIAVAAFAFAFFIWVMRRELADRLARSLAPVYRLLLNKYFVDELYDATVVHPLGAASREGLWRGVDVGVIDGAVNGVGAIVDAGAATLRRLQTGSIRVYASSLFMGVVLVLGYYLWR
jgi:NADH-quinone oxidoreductase subunit L